jgi:hypothetical protein
MSNLTFSFDGALTRTGASHFWKNTMIPARRYLKEGRILPQEGNGGCWNMFALTHLPDIDQGQAYLGWDKDG